MSGRRRGIGGPRKGAVRVWAYELEKQHGLRGRRRAGASGTTTMAPAMKEVSQLAIVPDGKRVTLASVAALEAAAEPSLTLLARPVRELPRVGMAEGVVADRVRGRERLAEILVRDLERRARRATPDACEAIRLELDAHRVLVRRLAPRFQAGGTDQVLNVVADLVCNHVRLCEVAGRAQALFHHHVEARIDVKLLIPRCIGWADVGCRVAAAAGGYAIGKHDKGGMLVGARRTTVTWQQASFEDRRPHVLRRSEDDT